MWGSNVDKSRPCSSWSSPPFGLTWTVGVSSGDSTCEIRFFLGSVIDVVLVRSSSRNVDNTSKKIDNVNGEHR